MFLKKITAVKTFLKKGRSGFLLIDVLVAVIIIQICITAITAAVISQMQYFKRLSNVNRELIAEHREINITLELEYQKEE